MTKKVKIEIVKSVNDFNIFDGPDFGEYYGNELAKKVDANGLTIKKSLDGETIRINKQRW